MKGFSISTYMYTHTRTSVTIYREIDVKGTCAMCVIYLLYASYQLREKISLLTAVSLRDIDINLFMEGFMLLK